MCMMMGISEQNNFVSGHWFVDVLVLRIDVIAYIILLKILNNQNFTF